MSLKSAATVKIMKSPCRAKFMLRMGQPLNIFASFEADGPVNVGMMSGIQGCNGYVSTRYWT